jgi:hypothetical protein
MSNLLLIAAIRDRKSLVTRIILHVQGPRTSILPLTLAQQILTAMISFRVILQTINS